MVNAPKKNVWPLPAGKYSKFTKKSTRQCHQANKGKSVFEAERVRVLEALRSLQSKKKLSAENLPETNIFSNEEKEKSIEDYVDS